MDDSKRQLSKRRLSKINPRQCPPEHRYNESAMLLKTQHCVELMGAIQFFGQVWTVTVLICGDNFGPHQIGRLLTAFTSQNEVLNVAY